MIRVFLIDDHQSFRQPFAFIVDHQPDMQVAGQAGTLAEARELFGEAPDIDVAIVDLDLPNGCGIDLIGDLKRMGPNIQILVLSGMRREDLFMDAVAAGAHGVIQKSASLEEILDTVRRIHNHEQMLTIAEINDMIQASAERSSQTEQAREKLASLTPREQEVLQALADGLNDRDISERLYISPDTVRRHMTNMLSKLEVNSRLQALVFAIRHEAVSID